MRFAERHGPGGNRLYGRAFVRAPLPYRTLSPSLCMNASWAIGRGVRRSRADPGVYADPFDVLETPCRPPFSRVQGTVAERACGTVVRQQIGSPRRRERCEGTFCNLWPGQTVVVPGIVV